MVRRAEPKSPLAKLVRQKQAGGLSFREMERRAFERGYRLGSSSFEQIAHDDRVRPLSRETVEAVAAGIGEAPQRVAELDALGHRLWVGEFVSAETAIAADPTFSEMEKATLLALAAQIRAKRPAP